MMWQSSSTHEPIRVRDQRIAKMPIAVERQKLDRAQRLDSLGTIAIFAVPAAWYVFNLAAAVLVGLVFAAACLTVWVQMRRQK